MRNVLSDTEKGGLIRCAAFRVFLPFPSRRYFALVVSFNALAGGKMYPLASQMSEKLIVRASNPGHFETDTSQLWTKGQTVNSVAHMVRSKPLWP